MKIFVSVVSFRDPLLLQTVRSLIDNQSGIYEIVVGIFEQTCIEDSLLTLDKSLTESPNIKYKRIDPEYADGVVWARAINAMQVTDENFFYQIDSHMLYEKDWDSYLISDWDKARQKSNSHKTIITANCKSFTMSDDGEPIKEAIDHVITCNSKYFTFSKRLHMPYAHGEYIGATGELNEAIHIFAGNFFAPVSWLKDVGYNTDLFFDGEEHSMVLMTFDAGYTMYHQSQIRCWHFRNTHNYITKHFIDPVVENKAGQLQARGFANWKKYITNLDKSLLTKYYEYSGLDYINCVIDERALTRQIIVPEGAED
jgi:hypothetical protein